MPGRHERLEHERPLVEAKQRFVTAVKRVVPGLAEVEIEPADAGHLPGDHPLELHLATVPAGPAFGHVIDAGFGVPDGPNLAVPRHA